MTWMPERTAKERFESIIQNMDPVPELDLSDLDKFIDPEQNIKIQGKTTSSDSAVSNLTGIAKSMGLDWSVPSDQLDRIILMDRRYVSGSKNPDLTEYVKVPADNESIVGHTNEVTVTSGSVFDSTSTSASIQGSNSDILTHTEKDLESQAKYGVIDARHYKMPWLTLDQMIMYSKNLIELYKSYEDRLISPTIIDVIPFLFSRFNYGIHGYDYPDDYKKEMGITHIPTVKQIVLKLLRKRVQYGSSGVTAELECVRWSEESGMGTQVPDSYVLSNINTDPNKWTLFTLDPATGLIEAYQGATTAEKDAFMSTRTRPYDFIRNYSSAWWGAKESPWGPVDDGHLVGWYPGWLPGMPLH
jgi:hypothetical protein